MKGTQNRMIRLIARAFTLGIEACVGEGDLGNYEAHETNAMRDAQVDAIVQEYAKEMEDTVTAEQVRAVLDFDRLWCVEEAEEDGE